MSIIMRNKNYYLRKYTPTRYKGVESRREILHSLHTDSLEVATKKAILVWGELIEAWEARLAGDTEDGEAKYQAARDLAKLRGFRYLPGAQVAKLPIKDLIARIDAIPVPKGKANVQEAVAMLGLAPVPEITVSRALDLFWGFADDRIKGKSDDQVRRWENPRKKAIKNFIEIIGDIPLRELTQDHMLDFREWWWEKIKEEDLASASGNKDFIHLANIFRTVNTMKRLSLDLPLSGLTFKAGEKTVRPPFSTKWIKEKILAPGALDGLNVEARTVLLGMINTGYRPSEAAELRPEHIRLDAEVPHISIEPVGRTLKSDASKRVIPLAGVSLEAFKASPGGFPRYRDSAALSATVNKFLRENGLAETPEHTMYCLRHSFEDRMLAANVDDRIRRDIFGHTLDRERYGSGATLEHKLRVIQSIAL